MNKILLDVLSLGAIISSILVITSKNPVIAVIFLISVFINAAGYLLLTGVTFVGITYIIVYIGAITVLFLFIIMMINIRLIDLLEFGREYTKNFPLAIFIGILFVYEIINVLPFMFNNVLDSNFNLPLDLLNQLNYFFFNTGDAANLTNFGGSYQDTSKLVNSLIDNLDNSYNNYNPGVKLNHFLQIEILGQSLYTYGAIWLLLSSIILLLSMVSALFLSSI
jgi:NADH-ubiquinone oxidoreductase chain 6